MKHKIVIINGSPRVDSNTMELADIFKKEVENNDGLAEVVNLREMKLGHCLGCWSADNASCKYPCVINDDLNAVFETMIHADGIVFVSGVYWFGVTSLMKLMIDRMTCLWNNGCRKPLLDGKPCAIITSSIEEGNVSASAPLLATSLFLGLHVLPYGMIYGDVNEKKDFYKGWAPDFARRAGRNMMRMIGILKQEKPDWWEYNNGRNK